MTIPSRHFLITQACMNAAVEEVPACLDARVCRRYLQSRTMDGTWISEIFTKKILKEFYALKDQYDRAADLQLVHGKRLTEGDGGGRLYTLRDGMVIR